MTVLMGDTGIEYSFGGTGADGALSTSGNVTYDEAEGTNTVKNYTSVTVNSGHTITRTNRGAIIWFVTGNVTINGTIDLDGLGYAAGTAASQVLKEPFSSSVNKWIELTQIQTLVGGTGGAGGTDGASGTGGVGGNGNAYSGGNGGGGGAWGTNGQAGQLNVGGYGADAGLAHSGGGGGGAGAGAGGDGNGGGSNGSAGGDYPGSALYIFADGNVTVGAAGIITVDGGTGGAGGDSDAAAGYDGAGGGGSGGGVICIVYSGSYTNNGSVAAGGGAGGAAGAGSGHDATAGSAGSAGTVYTNKYGT